MSIYRYEKEKNYDRLVKKILVSKFNNDISYFKDAEIFAQKYIKTLNTLKKIEEFGYINQSVKLSKYTNIDFINKEISLSYSDNPEALISQTLEFLSVKKVLPYSSSQFIEKLKEKDRKELHPSDEASKVLQWVKDRILNYQFSLSNLSYDRNNGKLSYVTRTRDTDLGSSVQSFTCIVEQNKIIQISSTDLKNNRKELSKDYFSLFAYFTMFGFTEIYAKCTCQEYNQKYGKKLGNANYFCPHILYSLSQLPYYLMYTFSQ